jgi:hypothetical protein
MAIDAELLSKARRNPAGLRFDEALRLARQLGFSEPRIRGSHHVMTHPLADRVRQTYPRPLNLQRAPDGKAKGYEVRQMLQIAEAIGIITSE